jgi:class 3 adenylate cyclase
MSQVADEIALAEAREAMGRQDWGAIYEALSPLAQDDRLDAETLPMFGGAAYFTGHLDEATRVWERAHHAAAKRGDRMTAAAAAAEVAGLMLERELLVPCQAWVARGLRMLEGSEDSPLVAALLNMRAGAFLALGKLEESMADARRALEIATRFDDPAGATLATLGVGQVHILRGEVEEGLRLLDEAVLAATSGQTDPVMTGVVFCRAMCSWQAMSEYERAEQWSEAMRQNYTENETGGARGRCRVHHAQVLRLHGAHEEATQEIETALGELRHHAADAERGWIMSELAGVKMRLGDLPGAETALTRAHQLGWPPQVGLARLALSRGDVASAASVIQDALEHPNDLPSFETPPQTELRRAPFLAVQAEVAVAAGDLDRARAASEELSGIAERYRSSALNASAATARGVVALGDEDHEAARKELETAARLWRGLGAPYETALVRLRLAEALGAAGRTDQGLLEARAARLALEDVGAKLDLKRARRLEEELSPARTRAREVRVFMFTDIVQSTNLAEAIGDEAWEHLVRWHNDTLNRLVSERGGEVVRTMGDGFFVTFDEPGAALDCAVDIQMALDRHRREHGFAPQVRIGMHLAEATREGEDWTGVGVHAAARIGALAGGGEVLTSRETAEAAGGGRTFSEPREVALKGIAEPVEVVTLEWR